MRIVMAIVAGFLSCAGQAFVVALLALPVPLAAQAILPFEQTAPVTKADRAKLPPEAAQALEVHDRIVQGAAGALASIPTLIVRAADNKVIGRSKGCQPDQHMMFADWADGAKIDYYYGGAVNCVPQGVGVIGNADGSVWIGEITDFGILREPAMLGKKRDSIYPIRTGLGILRTPDQMKNGGGIAVRSTMTNGRPPQPFRSRNPSKNRSASSAELPGRRPSSSSR